MVPVNCSHCGRAHEAESFPSINVALDPQLKARVKDGSLFVSECPFCGTRNLVRFQTLYHDPDRKLMVWLLPEGIEPPEAVSEAVKGLSGYTLRRVYDAGSLVEKVNLKDAGLDDAVMEMCKWVTRLELAEKNPAVMDAPMKFHRMEGADNEIVLAFPLNGQMQEVTVGFNVYEDARGILSRNPSVRPGEGFAVVDAAWVERYFR